MSGYNETYKRSFEKIKTFDLESDHMINSLEILARDYLRDVRGLLSYHTIGRKGLSRHRIDKLSISEIAFILNDTFLREIAELQNKTA